jgi:hypothetical protein
MTHLLRRSEADVNRLPGPSGIAPSAEMPWLAEVLAPRVSDLLPRVARCHAELLGLPRRTRRACQRQLARSADLAAILVDWSFRPVGRALQRRLARSVAGAALLLALTQGVGHAATINVETNVPAVNPGDGKCSLIEAIENANGTGAHGDCEAGEPGLDVIVLPKANHALGEVIDSTYGDTGLPLITSEIVIQGNGAKITRKASALPFRLIAVASSGDLTLDGVTLSGGRAEYGGATHNEGILTIQNSTITGNHATYDGGGVTSNLGMLTIESSTISGNTAGKGSAYGYGGGIVQFLGTASIANSTISGNQAAGEYGNYGGGIVNYGTMTIDDSTISSNKSRGTYVADGGGIMNFGDLTITNSTISGNRALAKYVTYGGGIETSSGSILVIRNSTISKNKAGSPFGIGGGIVSFGSTTVENSTVSGNTANGKFGVGGGIASEDTLTVTSSTITGNKAGPRFGYGGGVESIGDVILHTTLISGNKAGVGPEVDVGAGTVTADDFNLFGAKGVSGVVGFDPAGTSDVVPGPGVAIGKILEGLKDNGGPTRTHALKPGSPALNVVPSGHPTCTGAGADQRGIARPQPPGGNCDIGAFELE